MQKYYLAPLEGITGYIYRNAYHRYFTPFDKYFTPFIETHTKRSFNARERNDILPEHNEGLNVVPQFLTNNAEEFIRTAKNLELLGYREINLNLGCPSGTVTARKKGAGFLAVPKELDSFLEQVFDSLYVPGLMEISVKTRIGMSSSCEMEELLSVFNKYPLKELIVHPRVREDFYKNKPNLEVFGHVFENSQNPVCYNGDIFTIQDANKITEKFPALSTGMLGRGVIANPLLLEQICGLEAYAEEKPDRIKGQNKMKKEDEKQRIYAFHNKILEDYCSVISGDKNVLFKMKELWTYLGCIFTESERYCKKIRKSEKIREYEQIVDSLFREQKIIEGAGFKL